MMKEIEYKYLVDKEKWQLIEKGKPVQITQAYLYKSKEKTIRVRTKGNKGFITIKGKTEGITREEYEYEIPIQDAKELIENYTDKQISKKRYEIIVNNKCWEVDVFSGNLDGLILAELEVSSEDEIIEPPEWVTENVSEDPSYYNAILIDKA